MTMLLRHLMVLLFSIAIDGSVFEFVTLEVGFNIGPSAQAISVGLERGELVQGTWAEHLVVEQLEQ